MLTVRKSATNICQILMIYLLNSEISPIYSNLNTNSIYLFFNNQSNLLVKLLSNARKSIRIEYFKIVYAL